MLCTVKYIPSKNCFGIGTKRDARRLSEGDGVSIEKESLKIFHSFATPNHQDNEISKDVNQRRIRMAVARSSLGDGVDGCEPIKGTVSNLETWREQTMTLQSPKSTPFGTND